MDRKDRILVFSVTIVIGVAFIISGLVFLEDRDYLYQRVGILLLPGGALTIAVSLRWHLEPLLKGLTLDRKTKLVLFPGIAALLLWHGSMSLSMPLSIWYVVEGLVAMVVGFAAFTAFLRTLAAGTRPLSPGNLERLQREMERASLRPLGGYCTVRSEPLIRACSHIDGGVRCNSSPHVDEAFLGRLTSATTDSPSIPSSILPSKPPRLAKPTSRGWVRQWIQLVVETSCFPHRFVDFCFRGDDCYWGGSSSSLGERFGYRDTGSCTEYSDSVLLY